MFLPSVHQTTPENTPHFIQNTSSLKNRLRVAFVFIVPDEPHTGSGVERIDPFRFMARCHKRQLNQALSVLSLSIGFLSMLLVFIRVTYYVNVSLHWYVFCLLVVLVKLSLLAKCLATKTSLRKPFHSKEIIFIKLRPKSTCDFFHFCVLFYCVFVLSPALHNIFHTPILWHNIACLCWSCH